MFTTINSKMHDEDQQIIEAVCLSTDTKPTAGIANGSMLLEMDTGKIYAYDEDSTTWLEV